MVYQEAMPVFYGGNRFQFPEYYVKPRPSNYLAAHHALNRFLLQIGPQGRENIRKLSIPLLLHWNAKIPKIIKRHGLQQFSLNVAATKKLLLSAFSTDLVTFAPLEGYACQNSVMSLNGCVNFSFPQPNAKTNRATFGRNIEELFVDNDPLADHIRTQLKLRSSKKSIQRKFVFHLSLSDLK